MRKRHFNLVDFRLTLRHYVASQRGMELYQEAMQLMERLVEQDQQINSVEPQIMMECDYKIDASRVDCADKVMIVCGRLLRECLTRLLYCPERVFMEGGTTVAEAVSLMAEGMIPDLAIAVALGEEAVADAAPTICAARQRWPSVRWLLLTDAISRSRLQMAAASGVDGLLGQDISARVLRHAAELLLLGQTLLPAELSSPAEPASEIVTGAIVNEYQPGEWIAGNAINPSKVDLARCPSYSVHVHLSERERQILDFLARGYSNKLIARYLNIADSTVKVHVKALLRKLRVTNRTQAAIFALNERELPKGSSDVIDLSNTRLQRQEGSRAGRRGGYTESGRSII